MTINWDSQVLSSISKVIPHLSSIKINTEQLNEIGAHLSKEDFLIKWNSGKINKSNVRELRELKQKIVLMKK